VKIKLVKLHKREHKSEPFLRVNKFGQVPALVERRKGQVKFVLSESSAILKYLSEKYSLLVSESKMYSNDLRAKAKIWSALDWYQTTIRSSAAGVSWHAYVAGNMGGKVSLELAKHYEERLKMSLDVLETLRLGDKYPFLNEREHPSIADLLVIEDIVNLVVLKGSPFREELSSLDQLLAERPRVRKWRDAVMRINKYTEFSRWSPRMLRRRLIVRVVVVVSTMSLRCRVCSSSLLEEFWGHHPSQI